MNRGDILKTLRRIVENPALIEIPDDAIWRFSIALVEREGNRHGTDIRTTYIGIKTIAHFYGSGVDISREDKK